MEASGGEPGIDPKGRKNENGWTALMLGEQRGY